MLKLFKTIINPPDGKGNIINAIEASYYNTDDKFNRIEKSQYFRVGQKWTRGDQAEYEINKLILMLDRKKNTKLEAIMKLIDGPQLLNVNLLTLIKFWKLLAINPDLIIVNKDKRFEVIE
jgi:hypothetical protein